MYNFWVKELDCVSCGHTVPLFKDYRVAKERYADDPGYNVLCSDCGAVTTVDDWQSESVCNDCGHGFVPKEGNVSRGGKYNCPDCGQKYGITDAIQEQGGYNLRLYAIEYYCEHCDDAGEPKSVHKGYKRVEEADEELYQDAVHEWEESEDLHEYVPKEKIPPGHMTSERNPVFDHGYETWSDMFNKRQLLNLAKLLRSFEKIDRNKREFLLLAFSDALRTNSAMASYDATRNGMDHIFRTNSFDPPMYPAENNVWGGEFGRGTFKASWNMVVDGVEWANSPTDRYIDDGGEMVESAEFSKPVGEKSSLHQGDMRTLDYEDEFDAVITDPPYYDNIMYSEVADYFYVWQKILLEGSILGSMKKKHHEPNPSLQTRILVRPPRISSLNLNNHFQSLRGL
jgi:adenine-specific DNA methylase